jgi:hypothetical protein
MNNNILFTIIGALTLLVGTVGVNAFAQNVTEGTNQSGEYAQGAMNETGEAAGNVTEGVGKAVNETGEALSNATGNVIEGIQDIVNGSSK